MHTTATTYVCDMKSLERQRSKLIQRWRGRGHINATVEYRDKIYWVNQYLSMLDIFSLSSKGVSTLERKNRGVVMLHGLDNRNKILYAANYLDQALKIINLELLYN